MTGIDARTHAPVRVAATAAAPSNSHNSAPFGGWRGALRDAVVAELADFVSRHCAEALGDSGVDIATDVLMGFLHSGKCLRSTFAYLGWRCGADDNEPALRAAASFELLHAFALLQDDVMDGAAVRRGMPSAHVSFARWHRERGLSGSPERFGESAAVLLADLCLVWAEQMLRDSFIDPMALSFHSVNRRTKHGGTTMGGTTPRKRADARNRRTGLFRQATATKVRHPRPQDYYPRKGADIGITRESE